MNDSEIVALFWERNEDGIKAAAEKFGNYCAGIAQNILGSREDSKECLNDALWQAWKIIPPNRPENLAGFLGKLTRNIAINTFKKNNAEKRGGGQYRIVWEELSECVSDREEVEERLDFNDLSEALNVFLRGLPPLKRKICVLRYSGFEAIADIAAALDVKESYVLTTLSRTRKKLKAYLTDKGFMP